MFENIFKNQEYYNITEKILINLDVQSLYRCQMVCKTLYQVTKTLVRNQKLKENDLKNIRRIRWKKLLVHANWKAVFANICEEDNFYKRRRLLELLKTYLYHDKTLDFDGPISDSYLTASKYSHVPIKRTVHLAFRAKKILMYVTFNRVLLDFSPTVRLIGTGHLATCSSKKFEMNLTNSN